MATPILTDIRDLRNPTGIRIQYEILRERISQAAAVAVALRDRQNPDTHDFRLAQILDGMLEQTQGWTELDNLFGIEGGSHV